ncbi:MAG: hypothetical protein ACSW8A_00800 [Lachnospiraceae bacterium]
MFDHDLNREKKGSKRILLPAGGRLVLENPGNQDMVICIEDTEECAVYEICAFGESSQTGTGAGAVPGTLAGTGAGAAPETDSGNDAGQDLVREEHYGEVRKLLQQYPLVYAHEGQSVGNSFFYDFYFYDLTCESSRWLGDSRDLDEASVQKFVSAAAAYQGLESREPEDNDEEFYYAMMFGKKYIFGSREMEPLEAAFIELVKSIHL